MPRLELIFLRSGSADGCNGPACGPPPVSSYLKKTRQSSDRSHKQIPDRRSLENYIDRQRISGS